MKKGIAYALITAVLFVTLEPVSKLIAEDVTPYAITFWRFFIGSFILIPPAVIKIRKSKLRITLRDVILCVLLGILFICVSMLTLQLAVKKADAPSLIAILFSSNSLFTILFAIFILKEKLTRYKALALALGVVGVLFCTDFTQGTNLESVALALFAAVSFSLYTVLGKRFSGHLGGIVQSAIVFLTGSLVLLVMLLVGGTPLLPPLQADTLGILIYLGLAVTGVGYACYFMAIDKGGAIMASIAFFIKPILTPFVTLVINHIVPDWRVFAAVACIMAASYFAVYKKK